MEAGKLEITHKPFSLKNMAFDIEKIFHQQCESKKVAVNLNYSEEIPSIIVQDEFRIKQILNNLLSNALKFTEKGGRIDISFWKEDIPQSSAVKILFNVKDTGIGIPKDQQNKIFSSFEQVSGQSVEKYQGTGLGTFYNKTYFKSYWR